MRFKARVGALLRPVWARASARWRGPIWARAGACLVLPASANELLRAVRAAPETAWVRVNLNSFQSVWAPYDKRNSAAIHGRETARILGAWASFAWDSRRSSLILYGGGHANYSGNDVYTFHGSTRQWQRSSLPSLVLATDVGGGYTYGYAADGAMQAPASAHTYDNTVYLAQADRMLTFGGAAWATGGVYLKALANGGHAPTGPYLFDPKRAHPDKVGGSDGSGVDPRSPGGQMWENRDALAPVPGLMKPVSFVDGFSDATVVDGKDVVYVGAAQYGTSMDLYRYTVHDPALPARDSWELVGRTNRSVQATNTAGAVEPVRQFFIRTGDANLRFMAWDVRKSGHENFSIPIVPVELSAGTPVSFSGHGLAHDRRRGGFLLWGGGAAVWRLQPPPGTGLAAQGWTLQRLPVADGPVPAAQATSGGVLGKWQYAPELDAFVGLQDEVNGHVWVYKPAGWVDPASQDPPRLRPFLPTRNAPLLPARP